MRGSLSAAELDQQDEDEELATSFKDWTLKEKDSAAKQAERKRWFLVEVDCADRLLSLKLIDWLKVSGRHHARLNWPFVLPRLPLPYVIGLLCSGAVAYALPSDDEPDLQLKEGSAVRVLRLKGDTTREEIWRWFLGECQGARNLLKERVEELNPEPTPDPIPLVDHFLGEASLADQGVFTLSEEWQQKLARNRWYTDPWKAIQLRWLEILSLGGIGDSAIEGKSAWNSNTLSFPLPARIEDGLCGSLWPLLFKTHAQADPLILLLTCMVKALLEAGAVKVVLQAGRARLSCNPSGEFSTSTLRNADSSRLEATFPLSGWKEMVNRTGHRRTLEDLGRLRVSRPDFSWPLRGTLVYLEGGIPLRESPWAHYSQVRCVPLDRPYSVALCLKQRGDSKGHEMIFEWPGCRCRMDSAGMGLPAGVMLLSHRAFQRDPSLTRVIDTALLEDIRLIAHSHVPALIQELAERPLRCRETYLAVCTDRGPTEVRNRYARFESDLSGNALSVAGICQHILVHGYIGSSVSPDCVSMEFRQGKILREPLARTLKQLDLTSHIWNLDYTLHRCSSVGDFLETLVEVPD
ncbi:hypothetical protein IV102_05740 [bacterium]|nr:hypothetical protein [bacterium]